MAARVVQAQNVPIHLYGQCLDQDGKPLPYVGLNLSVRQWYFLPVVGASGRFIQRTVASDADGRFELKGVTGDVAGVDLAIKEGYDWVQRGRSSASFDHSYEPLPTYVKPLILWFWKRLGAEPLYHNQPFLATRLRCDGTSATGDLITGKKEVAGDNPFVRFALKRNPEALPNQSSGKFDWHLTVEIPGGGMQQTFTNMPFAAPTNGYVPSVLFSVTTNDLAWRNETNANFYYRTAKGQYGYLTVHLSAGYPGTETPVRWNSLLNPTGSRVLEFDYAKRIKLPPELPPRQTWTAPTPAFWTNRPPPGYEHRTNLPNQAAFPPPPNAAFGTNRLPGSFPIPPHFQGWPNLTNRAMPPLPPPLKAVP